MSLPRKIFVIILLLSVSACGFRPVYKEGKGGMGASAALRSVEIGDVSAKNTNRQGITVLSRHTQALRSKLQDLFNPKGTAANHKYRLEVVIGKSSGAQAIEQNREITRRNITVTANYKLIEIESSLVVNGGKSVMVSSFDVVTSDYANFASEEDALIRTTKSIAGDIRFRVVGFLTNPDREDIIQKLKDKQNINKKAKSEDSSGEN